MKGCRPLTDAEVSLIAKSFGVKCPRIVYTDLNGLICKMRVTVERTVTFETAGLLEWPAEVRQDP